MKIYFDENFSPHLARGFSAFQAGRPEEGFEVLHIIEAFERGTPDEDWIPEIARQHGVVITQDYGIHRSRQLAEMCRHFKLGVFIFRFPRKGYTYWEIVEFTLKRWNDIKRQAKHDTAPYTYEVRTKSIRPCRL